MKRYLFLGACLIFLNSAVGSIIPNANGSIEYKISMLNPLTHYFQIEILLKGNNENFVDFKMPVWTPGSYLIREYPKNLSGFEALDGKNGRKLEFEKTNKNTWRVQHNKASEVLIKYNVYAFDGVVRMSYLDDSHAFIMANTVLMYVESLRNSSSVLKLQIPENWRKISTSLSKLEGKENAFYVPNYDILVDSPIEVGNQDVIEFVAAGVYHEVAMYAPTTYNPDHIIRDLTKIIETATEIFGENPNEKYTFIIHHNEYRSGGLEHENSTVLGINRWTYANENSYEQFLALAAHEYFHLWLVKRLKPVEFEFIDYDQEVYSDLLWLMEGITSYFEEKIMLRSGFYDPDQFINNLISEMAKIKNTPGADVQSVADASFDAWINFYRRDANSENVQVSYYNKGTVLGVLLDLMIINGSDGRTSLDDVLNHLYYQFYKKKAKGITTADLQKEIEKMRGVNNTAFFKDYIYGTERLDNEKYLEYAGIRLVELNGSVNTNSVGIGIMQKKSGLFVTSVLKGSSAYDNGIFVGDELISINEYRLTNSNSKTIINQFDVGQEVVFLVNRNGIMKEIKVDIRKDERISYTFELVENKTKLQEKVFRKWLKN